MKIENTQNGEMLQGVGKRAFSDDGELRLLDDHYILGACWLASATGDIYAAWDVSTGIDNVSVSNSDNLPPQFFIKFLPDNDPHAAQLSQIMKEEYEELASCFSWCENISLAEDKNRGYLVLQLPQGEFLSRRLATRKAKGDLATVLPLLTNINSALNNLQHCGIRHGRVAPDSIFIMSNGAVGLVDSLYVVAKQRLLAEDHEGATTIPNRDALYASPDVCFGREVSEQDNVFSLACLCYHLLSGQHPFAGNNSVSALLNKTRPTPIATLSEAQWQHLEYGLSFAQESRPKTVSEFINGFETVSKLSNTIKKKNKSKETAVARKNAQNIINQKKPPKTVKKVAIANKKPTEQKYSAGVTSSRKMTLPTWSWIPLSLLAGISVGVIATILSIHLLDVNLFSFVKALVGFKQDG